MSNDRFQRRERAVRAFGNRHVLTWGIMLGGPMLGLIQLPVAYMLAVWVSHGNHTELPMHLVSAVCLAGALLAGWTGWRELRSIRNQAAHPTTEKPPERLEKHSRSDIENKHIEGRIQLMAGVAVLSGLVSALWILGQWIAVFAFLPWPSRA